MSEEVQNIMKANLGNYKGVMLCNRPGEDLKNAVEKPFISRVNPKDNWGLLPEKKREAQILDKKKGSSTLDQHKQWLSRLKKQVQEKKYLEDNDEQIQKEKFNKIREIGIRNREVTKRIKQQYEDLRHKVMQDLEGKANSTKKLSKANLDKFDKKKNGPAWAKSEEQLQQEENDECDQLLDFVDNLDYDKYIDDLEVQNMLNSLKERIDDLKEEMGPQEKKQAVDHKMVDQEDQNIKKYFEEDGRSQVSEGRTMVSHESKRSVQMARQHIEHKLAKEAKQWDNTSQASRQSAGFQDRVAKKVADEILSQYKNLKGVHSNSSIRKILEQEALKCLNNSPSQNQPQICKIKDPSLVQINVNPSTLPYLHRNPAI